MFGVWCKGSIRGCRPLGGGSNPPTPTISTSEAVCPLNWVLSVERLKERWSFLVVVFLWVVGVVRLSIWHCLCRDGGSKSPRLRGVWKSLTTRQPPKPTADS